MAGLSFNWYELREQMMQECCELWHELTGGELYWYVVPAPRKFDIFERMEIANLTGVTFRG